MHGSRGVRSIFGRIGGLEFDISEMSSTEFFTRHVREKSSLVAIPVFPSRVFHHGMMAINRKFGIRTSKDLNGKRIGLPLYVITAAVTAHMPLVFAGLMVIAVMGVAMYVAAAPSWNRLCCISRPCTCVSQWISGRQPSS